MTATPPAAAISRALALPEAGVNAVLQLLSEGNTLPFIARYRKEATGGLDEVAIEGIQAESARLKALDDRRQTILTAIEEQGKLSAALRQRIAQATDKATLEDLYQPFKRKRKTRASVARERGLEPLARQIRAQGRGGSPAKEARRFVRSEVATPEDALQGARDIVAEELAEAAPVRALARQLCRRHGRMASAPKRGMKAEELGTFRDYAEHAEPLGRIPSHRYLAMCRGEEQGKLRVFLDIEAENLASAVKDRCGYQRHSPWAGELRTALIDSVKRLLLPSLERELRAELRERAEEEAAAVFARNLEDLLMAAPFGQRPVLAIDPGFRTGCKVVALSATGAFLGSTVIQPHRSKGTEREAQRFLGFLSAHPSDAVAIGTGTAGRETQAWVRERLRGRENAPLIVMVNESGASIYSASPAARAEFPDLDLTLRGAISIGRRLQDPLAELVKIDPAALGIGQYQHDIRPSRLEQAVASTVSRCVNRVGVELNTASAALLEHVAGIGPALARRIVDHREQQGPFRSRAQLRDVKGLGARTFEQCAGFLRIRDAAHPLDASAVHPERYALVARIAAELGCALPALIGNDALIEQITPARYPEAGAPTLADIRSELLRPGRDPRAAFRAPRFRDDLHSIEDLARGMELEGVVTNVTAFGAFVDLGVHCDGLIHKSQLSRRRVRDPLSLVGVGAVVQVEVVEIDLQRQRIGLRRIEE
jgi:uncharacterized protein